MKEFVSDIAFTPSVKAQQAGHGSRDGYARMEQGKGWADRVSDRLRRFIEERDSFYLGTANADGQPYIQHRGGPKGFLKILDERTLAFADFGGNRQYITAGNLAENDKAYIFLMDYAKRQRFKVWGKARVVEDDPELLTELSDPNYKAAPERAIVFHIEAWDVNCPQHIVRRYTEDQIDGHVAALQGQVDELQTRNAKLEARLAEIAASNATLLSDDVRAKGRAQ